MLFSKSMPFVWFIVLLSCIPYLLLKRYHLSVLSTWFMPIKLSDLVDPFSIWRLWTPTFVHYQLLHLLVNIYLWILFASQVELRSSKKLIVLFLLIASCANLSQWWFLGVKFGGLSGVIYGLLGYIMVMQYYLKYRYYYVDPMLLSVMLALIPVMATGMFGKYANYAHIGGLMSGILFAILESKGRKNVNQK